MSKKEILDYFENVFDISAGRMKQLIKDFHAEMEKGLAGSKSSLKMIPTYVDRPAGREKGRFIALDLGGTNFRILEVELKGDRSIGARRVMKFSLENRYITDSGIVFFDFLADCIRIFLNKFEINDSDMCDLGFTFSFPVNQTDIAGGTLVCWTKGFSAKGVIGHDVVELLNEALARKGIRNIRVAALTNDTTGTLMARCYEDPDCDVGVIIGTGTNACYEEELSKIPKWDKKKTYYPEKMIINTEWGNFNKVKRTDYDIKLDNGSNNPGSQVMEKMISGRYLGGVAGLVFEDLIKKKVLFGRTSQTAYAAFKDFRAEHMSSIEEDSSESLAEINNILKKLGISKSARVDRALVQKACGIISRRAARISAAALAAVITKMDPGLSRRHTVAIDGSVYEKHPRFAKNMKAALKEIFDRNYSRINIVLTKDGSGIGAAIIAAVARKRQSSLGNC